MDDLALFLVIATAAVVGLWALGTALKRLAIRFLPDWLAGPGGTLFDTSGSRLGILDRQWTRHRGWGGGGSGCDGC